MIETKTTMTMAHFHDFYYLIALQAGLAGRPDLTYSHSATKLRDDIQDTLDSVAENIAKRTFVYLFAACLGESRHAREKTARDRFCTNTLKLNRNALYETVTDYAPSKHNFDALVSIFDQPWEAGFGGKAWRDIAKALHAYATLPAAAFIDHVIDLEHNNGTVFNKRDAKYSIRFSVSYDGHFRSFLDYKFRRDILKNRSYNPLSVSRPVYKLIQRYATITNTAAPDWVYPGLETLDEYYVTWGTGRLEVVTKWKEWAQTINGNVPTISEMMTSIENLDPHRFTFTALKKEVTKLKKQALLQAKPYMQTGMKKKFDQKTKLWLQGMKKYCKVRKAKVRYIVVPCQVSYDGSLHLRFPTLPNWPFSEETIGYQSILYYSGTGTHGGWENGHLGLHKGQIVVKCHKYSITFTHKQMEAHLD